MKYFFAVNTRCSIKGPEEFENFIANFELLLSIVYAECPFCIITTCDSICMSRQLWEGHIDTHEEKVVQPLKSGINL